MEFNPDPTSKISLKLFPIKTMLKLFDACITPILLYGSEIWGAYTNIDHNKWESTPIEEILNYWREY